MAGKHFLIDFKNNFCKFQIHGKIYNFRSTIYSKIDIIFRIPKKKNDFFQLTPETVPSLSFRTSVTVPSSKTFPIQIIVASQGWKIQSWQFQNLFKYFFKKTILLWFHCIQTSFLPSGEIRGQLQKSVWSDWNLFLIFQNSYLFIIIFKRKIKKSQFDRMKLKKNNF